MKIHRDLRSPKSKAKNRKIVRVNDAVTRTSASPTVRCSPLTGTSKRYCASNTHPVSKVPSFLFSIDREVTAAVMWFYINLHYFPYNAQYLAQIPFEQFYESLSHFIVGSRSESNELG